MVKSNVQVIQRLMNGALVSSFERWRDHIMEEQQMKGKALKVELNACVYIRMWCIHTKHTHLRMTRCAYTRNL